MKAQLLKVRPKTLIEWLVVAGIVAILVALLIPRPKWASSGSLTIPVKVVVFDVPSAMPIEGAFVAIVRAPPATGDFELHEYQDRLSPSLSIIQKNGVPTDTSGTAMIQHEFRTGANHERPISRANTRGCWVLVSADDYGSVAVPLRYELIPSKELRERGSLPAYVGLTRINSK